MRENETPEDFMIRTFAKYCDCQIGIEKNPYFSEELDIKDKFFNTKSKYQLFTSSVEAAGSIDNYVDNYHKARTAIINDIVNTDEYKRFNGKDSVLMNDHVQHVLKDNAYRHTNIFNDTNVGKKFISIDMRHANFSILQNIGVYNNELTYNDIMHKYNVDEFMLNSKRFRQTTFGRTNEKRIGRYEQFHVLCIANSIKEIYGIEPLCVLHDEIVFEYTDEAYDKIIDMVKTSSNFTGIDYKCEAYTLYKIEPIKAYMKVYFDRYDSNKDSIVSYDDIVDGKYKFEAKCLKNFYSRAFYHWLADGVVDKDDFYFLYEDLICNVVDKLPEFEICV